MPITTEFSVRSDDIEEARAWIEAATGLSAEARESSHWGGDYYAFYGPAGENMRLFSNRDISDGDLIIGDSFDCVIGLVVDDAERDSPVLEALRGAAAKFEKMKEESY